MSRTVEADAVALDAVAAIGAMVAIATTNAAR